jgi:hypothetical protein
MWCIWKARNDKLFNKKDNHLRQIHRMAHAINQNLEKVYMMQVLKNMTQGNNPSTRDQEQNEDMMNLKKG